MLAYCRECQREAGKRDRESGKAKVRGDRWRNHNREILREQSRLRYAANPQIKLAANREWVARNPERVKAVAMKSRLKRDFDITVEQYQKMWEEQKGLCAICDSDGWGRRLVVDHCHITHTIRGLLCWRCNGALGIIGEDNMGRAVEYLRRVRMRGEWP